MAGEKQRGQVQADRGHLSQGSRPPPDLLLGPFWGWGQEPVFSEVPQLFDSYILPVSPGTGRLLWWSSEWGAQTGKNLIKMRRHLGT